MRVCIPNEVNYVKTITVISKNISGDIDKDTKNGDDNSVDVICNRHISW